MCWRERERGKGKRERRRGKTSKVSGVLICLPYLGLGVSIGPSWLATVVLYVHYHYPSPQYCCTSTQLVIMLGCKATFTVTLDWGNFTAT